MSASIIPRLLFCLALALPVSSRAYVPAIVDGESVLFTTGSYTVTLHTTINTQYTRGGFSVSKFFAAGASFQVRCVPPGGDKVFHGNTKTKKFHASKCRYFDCKNCVVVFRSRDRAIRAGYVPCKVCRP